MQLATWKLRNHYCVVEMILEPLSLLEAMVLHPGKRCSGISNQHLLLPSTPFSRIGLKKILLEAISESLPSPS